MTEYSDETIRAGVAEWFNREGPLNTTLEELTRYAIAVANAPTSDISKWQTTRCPECELAIREMGVEKEQHLTLFGNILVCCEWYWVVSPAAVGMPAGQWDDWTQYHGPEGELENWKAHGER